jgi:hypothetical protein
MSALALSEEWYLSRNSYCGPMQYFVCPILGKQSGRHYREMANVLRSASSTSRNLQDTTLDLHPQPGCETGYLPSKPQYNNSNKYVRVRGQTRQSTISLWVTALDLERSQLRGRAVEPPGCQVRLAEQTFPDICSHYATEQSV